jgi:hypothetical protein
MTGSDGPYYRVSFTIGPVENPSTIGLRIAELIALLKQDDGTDVQVQIWPYKLPADFEI